MFENIGSFFKKIMKNETKELVSDTTATNASKEAAKERLHLVLMQDRANVSADFLELMKQEIVDVIKKYIVIEEDTIDVRIINQENEDGTNGAPSLCANIPILNIRNDNKGEKFRKENIASVTNDITSEIVVEESSDNNSNDNIEIEKEEIKENVDNEIVENSDNITDEVIVVEEIIEEKNQEINNENNVEELEVEENLSNIDLEQIEELDDILGKDDSLENYDDDDDDDDVTFDDLLKAAEEEEKMQKQEKKTSPSNNSKSKSKASKGASKNTNKRKKTNKK